MWIQDRNIPDIKVLLFGDIKKVLDDPSLSQTAAENLAESSEPESIMHNVSAAPICSSNLAIANPFFSEKNLNFINNKIETAVRKVLQLTIDVFAGLKNSHP